MLSLSHGVRRDAALRSLSRLTRRVLNLNLTFKFPPRGESPGRHSESGKRPNLSEDPRPATVASTDSPRDSESPRRPTPGQGRAAAAEPLPLQWHWQAVTVTPSRWQLRASHSLMSGGQLRG